MPSPFVSEEKVGWITAAESEWRLFADGVPGAGSPDQPGTCYWILYQKDRYALAEFQTSYRLEWEPMGAGSSDDDANRS